MEDQQFKKQYREMMSESLKKVPSFEKTWHAAQNQNQKKVVRLKFRLGAAAAVLLAISLVLFLWLNNNSSEVNRLAAGDLNTWRSPTDQLLAGNAKRTNSDPLLHWESPTSFLLKPIELKSSASILNQSIIK